MNLDFYAGSRALQRIRSSGLKADDVQVMAGAAGGPKWLILGHLDRVIFSSWVKDRKKPLFLVGSSSGAWRFAMTAQTDPVAAVTRFEQAYIHQYYSKNPTPAEIRREAIRILNDIMPDEAPGQILSHPFLRLNVMSVRCKGPVAREAKPVLMICPSKSFLSALPYSKIPDRSDFNRLAGKDKARVAYWQQAADSGKLLADAFMEAILSDRIRVLVHPMPWERNHELT